MRNNGSNDARIEPKVKTKVEKEREECMKAARPQGQVTHKFKCIFFSISIMDFIFKVQCTENITFVCISSLWFAFRFHYSEYLNYYLILLLGIISSSRSLIFFCVYEPLTESRAHN